MPQTTNRSLVGQMNATPIGRGTVYNAMLKVSSTNRERAVKVNNSEGQRLQKVTRVMEKDERYSGWKADMQMEKTRKSLLNLTAFKRVLSEDFPVKHFTPAHTCPSQETEESLDPRPTTDSPPQSNVKNIHNITNKPSGESWKVGSKSSKSSPKVNVFTEAMPAAEALDMKEARRIRREILEKRRAERKERVMNQIYTRGFDMKTLSREIDRKLKTMDPVRQRRKFNRLLISESRDLNDRIITENMSKFKAEVMEKATPVSKATHTHISNPEIASQDTSGEKEEVGEVNGEEAVAASVDAAEGKAEDVHKDAGGTSVGETPQGETQLNAPNPLLHKLSFF